MSTKESSTNPLHSSSSSNAMKSGKVKSKSEALEAPKEVEVPPELTCSLCKELFKDAVIIPCCGESFCDECEHNKPTNKQTTFSTFLQQILNNRKVTNKQRNGFTTLSVVQVFASIF